MKNNSYYDRVDLMNLGFKKLGENVLVSMKASIYGAENISIENNVRIDDFCILSGSIQIGSYIHIAAYSAIYGGTAGVEIDDFVNISSRVTIYAECDDFSGITMTNPLIPIKYKNICNSKVTIKKHAIIGATSVILPGAVIGEGSAFGSFSFVNKSTEAWSMNVGIPCKKIGERKKNLLDLEKKFWKEMEGTRDT